MIITVRCDYCGKLLIEALELDVGYLRITCRCGTKYVIDRQAPLRIDKRELVRQ